MLLRGRVVVVIMLLAVINAPAFENCMTQQNAVTAARSRIRLDQNSVRELKAGYTAKDFEEWADAAEAERREVVKDSFLDSMGIMADGLTASTEVAKDALKPMNIAGVYLPHGVGSLGTGQANLIIGRLQRFGGGSAQVQTLIDNVRALSSFQNKTDTLEFAAKVHDIASAYKESSDFGKNLTDTSSGDPVKIAAVGLQLVSGLAGQGATISVDVGEALFTGVEHLIDAYLISSIISNLSNPTQPLSNPRYEVEESNGTLKPLPSYHPTGKQDVTEAQLASLKVLARKLERDVSALQDAKSRLASCQASNAHVPGKSGSQPLPPITSAADWKVQGLGTLRLWKSDPHTKRISGVLHVDTGELEGIPRQTALNMSGTLDCTSLLLKGYQTSGGGDYIHMDKEVPSYQFMLSIEAQFDQVSAPTHLDGNGTLTKSALFRGDKGKVVKVFGIIATPAQPPPPAPVVNSRP